MESSKSTQVQITTEVTGITMWKDDLAELQVLVRCGTPVTIIREQTR